MLLSATFTSGVLITDGISEYQLRKNIKQISAGMTDKEVTAILGRPTSKSMSDIGPACYWVYKTDTFNVNSDGYLVLEMSSKNTVTKVFDF